jgi:hypothetical protein
MLTVKKWISWVHCINQHLNLHPNNSENAITNNPLRFFWEPQNKSAMVKLRSAVIFAFFGSCESLLIVRLLRKFATIVKV